MTLYRQEILEHVRSPQNFGKLKRPDVAARADNPVCGDAIELELQLTPDGKIKKIRFYGVGCAITTASASMFTEAVKGKKLANIAGLSPDEALKLIGLEVTPARKGCATLVWVAAKGAYEKWHAKEKI